MKGVDYQRCDNLALVRECKETLQRGVKEIDRGILQKAPRKVRRAFIVETLRSLRITPRWSSWFATYGDMSDNAT